LAKITEIFNWSIQDAQKIFDKMVKIASIWNAIDLDLISTILDNLNTNLVIYPLFDALSKKFIPNYDWDSMTNHIIRICYIIHSKFGALHKEDVNWILHNYLPGAIDAINYLNLTPENIIDFMIENNKSQSFTIESMLQNEIIKDSKIINKFIAHFKDAELASTILNKYPNTVGDNYLFLQTIVEKYGNPELILMATRTTLKNANLAPLKKRYNVIMTKKIKEDPSILTNIQKEIDRISFLRTFDRSIELLQINNSKDNIGDYRSYQDDYRQYIDMLKEKNDWFSLNKNEMQKIFSNKLIVAYKLQKNKTFIELYNEAFKNDHKSLSTALGILIDSEQYSEFNYLAEITKIIPIFIEKSSNFAEYIKYCSKLNQASKLHHNSNIATDILKLAMLNKGFDIEDPLNANFLEILNDISNDLTLNALQVDIKSELNYYIKTAIDINKKMKRNTINIDNLTKNIDIISNIIEKFKSMQPFSWKKGTEEYNAFISFHNDISLIKEFETIQEYISEAKPKNEFFKNLNMNIDNLSFSVLEFLDPYAFKVEADTDCCQRIGGAGEDAAIDSFINPEAGVLLLKKDNMLLAQSYFHYVPNDNGIILDNIEVNDDNLKRLNINNTMLSKIYANYAAALKEKMPELNYIKCGMNYNKIDNNLFGKSKMEEDPRHFEVDDPYSDFDEDLHLDLLKPSEQLKNIVVMAKNLVSLSKKQIIKVSDVRRILLTKLALNN